VYERVTIAFGYHDTGELLAQPIANEVANMNYFRRGQCKTQTADGRLQTGGKMQTEGKMQTADQG